MSDPKFVHLRVHTEFSLSDGLVRVKGLVKAAAENQMPAVAVTDHVNFFALVKFYKAALGAGVKPICGSDVYLYDPQNPDQPLNRLTLLVMNAEGYRNLMELISLAYEKGQNYIIDKAVVLREWVIEKSGGLIALSGAKEGEVGRAILADKGNAQQVLEDWMSVFNDRFYLEVQRTNRIGDEEVIHGSVALARATGCPLVACNDVMFLQEDEFEAHEVRVCINQGRVYDDPTRPKAYSESQYFKSTEEMQALFSDIPSALSNTVEIAKRCNIDIELGTYYLPKYPVPEGMLMDDFFRQVSLEGLEERLEVILDRDDPEYDAKRQVYIERLDFELDIIIQMGFPGYFLIVMDFIKWGKD
ncbi:MAG: PHP domain-containing protein, partial [Pontibacterium sp.]